MGVLKKQAHDRAQASLAQLESLKHLNLIPEEAKRTNTAFLSTGENDNLVEKAPEANAYEFQSQGIIDMLQKLLDKFTEELTTLEKEESESVHAFKMLKQDLKNDIEHAEEAREIASATK